MDREIVETRAAAKPSNPETDSNYRYDAVLCWYGIFEVQAIKKQYHLSHLDKSSARQIQFEKATSTYYSTSR
jgi:hypothetical protein